MEEWPRAIYLLSIKKIIVRIELNFQFVLKLMHSSKYYLSGYFCFSSKLA